MARASTSWVVVGVPVAGFMVTNTYYKKKKRAHVVEKTQDGFTINLKHTKKTEEKMRHGSALLHVTLMKERKKCSRPSSWHLDTMCMITLEAHGKVLLMYWQQRTQDSKASKVQEAIEPETVDSDIVSLLGGCRENLKQLHQHRWKKVDDDVSLRGMKALREFTSGSKTKETISKSKRGQATFN